MAILKYTVGTPSFSTVYRDLVCDINAELIQDGAVNVQQVFIDNKLNATDFYLTMWNRDGSGGEPTTPGGTQPDMVLFCPAKKSKNYIFPRNLAFSAALSIFGSTNWLATAFTPESPTNAVPVTIYISA